MRDYGERWLDAVREGTKKNVAIYVDPRKVATPVRVFPADDPYGLKEEKMEKSQGFHTKFMQIIKEEGGGEGPPIMFDPNDKTIRATKSKYPSGTGIFFGFLGGSALWLVVLVALVLLGGCSSSVVAPEPEPDPEPIPQCIDLEGVYNSVEYGGTTYTSFQLLVNVDPNELIGRNTIPGLLAPFSAGFVLTDDDELLWTYVNGGSQTNMWLFRDVTLRLECDGITGYYAHAATPVLRFRK